MVIAYGAADSDILTYGNLIARIVTTSGANMAIEIILNSIVIRVDHKPVQRLIDQNAMIVIPADA